IFPVTWLTHADKMLSGQGMVFVREAGSSQVSFTIYSHSSPAPVSYQYSKTWNSPIENDYDYCDDIPSPKKIPKEYVSGDFNGDGLTDVIAITRPFYLEFCYPI